MAVGGVVNNRFWLFYIGEEAENSYIFNRNFAYLLYSLNFQINGDWLFFYFVIEPNLLLSVLNLSVFSLFDDLLLILEEHMVLAHGDLLQG